MSSRENVYVVIDLGTSFIRGLATHKLENGEISPIACETLPSDGFISHGAVYNIDGVAEKIGIILERLNERLEDNYAIDRLYVGLGAQSLRSEEVTIKIDLDEEGEEITDKHLQEVIEKVEGISFPRKVIVDYLAPYYEIDGRIEAFPRSIVCREFIAHISIITVKDWIFNNIKTVIEDRLKLQLEGVLVTPLCEAMAMLSPSQMQLGSVFVSIGGGTTSVVIFQDGVFRRLRVLPFGGANLTKDLESLRLTPEHAEEIKLQYAGATTYADRDKTFEIPNFDGIGMRSMRVLDVNRYTAARMKEIVENLFEVVKQSGYEHQIKAGYLFTGGGCKIMRLEELLRNYTRTLSFNTQLASVIDHNNALVATPGMETAIALAVAAKKNCVAPITTDLKILAEQTERDTRTHKKAETYQYGDQEDYLAPLRQKQTEEMTDDTPSSLENEVEEDNNHTNDSKTNGVVGRIKTKVSSLFSSFKEKLDDDDDDDEL